ncbi:MAG: carbamoyl-phosphate synthase large subunit [Armatimonadota bacterium]|nr:carbamoyl-phosphate synthase large subunit [Armatimonadota bacterium]MDR7451248.1 carbamoyl-phosphate synthase large subunit [Armatimonadota bacterium]MDR7466849.1 carbamoyl-phosphate synthase large subunit [Armatimonadota bacterium]MDR7492678.1 carbamoyl-phosphate synthase large subunit [Armatimonadota bacterium]MDR7499607.1 carbamoyl-phosphate synthase large subunit [Armatimonadota bacterium]
MPARADLRKVLVIGSGPIVIGQAAEFDYSGTQACRALSEEGLEVVLVNSNPATIMTDVETADRVYVEPLLPEVVARILERERPDGLLATLGGQTALNLALALSQQGLLAELGVELLGTPIGAIQDAEDRDRFRSAMLRLGQPVPASGSATTVAEALEVAEAIGYPVVVRPAFTLGGTGGGTAGDARELALLARRGLGSSPIGQVLVEQYLGGWKEIEYEVMRDAAGTAITVCNMENVDPMGVHTGDSVVVAPSLTLSDTDYQRLRAAALQIIAGLGIAGGCNIQFALHPESGDYRVIEVNPRVSRSSALASKATGYPIARVAAKIAVGLRLDEIPNRVTGATMAAFEPALDYVVVKIPRWPFDKFPIAERRLGTQMKATGEVMAIGRTFPEALLKALRSLDLPVQGLLHPECGRWSDDDLEELIREPTDLRLFALAEALRRGMTVERIAALSQIDPYFVTKIAEIVAAERALAAGRGSLREAKRLGLPDATIAALTGGREDEVRAARRAQGLRPVFKVVDTCAGEFPARTPYFYSTYEEEDEVPPAARTSVIVLGSGPIRIGQGIEFDYSTVHAVRALREAGYAAVIINNNPETVSTDFDISDRLYFEPLTLEDVLHVAERERPLGVLVQFGGQTAINLAGPLAAAGVPILGTPVEALDVSEDREKFSALLAALEIPCPEGGAVTSLEAARALIARLRPPVLVRPSYVLGGRGMEIAGTADEAVAAVRAALDAAPGYPVLIDRYIAGQELELDAVADGVSVLIPGIMEHVERAGVHSGDSIAVFPAHSLPAAVEDRAVEIAARLARRLGIRGFLNLQYVYDGEQLYVLEANLRSSRTVPFVSKAVGVSLVQIATRVMLGDTLADLGFPGVHRLAPPTRVAVKAPVFSMEKLGGAEAAVGPEMRSTGEVMGIDADPVAAMCKAVAAAGFAVRERTVLASIADRDKRDAPEVLALFARAGFRILATPDTARALRGAGLEVEAVSSEEAFAAVPIGLVVNTPTRGGDPRRDGFQLRRRALDRRIPCLTSLETARVVAEALQHDLGRTTIEPLAGVPLD